MEQAGTRAWERCSHAQRKAAAFCGGKTEDFRHCQGTVGTSQESRQEFPVKTSENIKLRQGRERVPFARLFGKSHNGMYSRQFNLSPFFRCPEDDIEL